MYITLIYDIISQDLLNDFLKLWFNLSKLISIFIVVTSWNLSSIGIWWYVFTFNKKKEKEKRSPISYLILDMNLSKLYGLYLFYYPHGDVNLHLTFSNPRQVLPIYWNLFKDEFHWFSVFYLLLAQNVFFSNLHASWYKQLHISIQLQVCIIDFL